MTLRRDEICRRHAEHYLKVLNSADDLYLTGSGNIPRGLALFDLEWANIQLGQAWAALHAPENDKAAIICCDYPHAGRYCLVLRQHPRDQIKWMEAGLIAARQLKDRIREGIHLGNLGLAYSDLGEIRKAIECYEQRLVVARKIRETSQDEAERAMARRGEGNVLGNLGVAYYSLGEMRKAIEFHEQRLVIAREISAASRNEAERAMARRGEANALGNLGLACAALNETRIAIEYHEQALQIDRVIGDRRGEGQDLNNLGFAYADLHETRKAIEYYEQSLQIDREMGDRWGEGRALGNLGNAFMHLGETRKAIETYQQRLIIAREVGDRRGEGNAFLNMSLALDKLHERPKAIELAQAALKIYEQVEDPNAEIVRQQLATWDREE